MAAGGPSTGAPDASPAETPVAATPPAEQPPAPAPGLTLVDVRRLWPDIVDATKLRRRLTWIHLTQHAQVMAVDATTLTLGFSNAGARESFTKGGSAEIVRQAAIDVVGADWQVEAIVDPSAQPDASAPVVTRAASTFDAPAPAADAPGGPSAAAPVAVPEEPPSWARDEPAAPEAEETAVPTAPDPTAPDPTAHLPTAPGPGVPDPSAAAREAIQQTRSQTEPAVDTAAAADEEAHPDDPDVEHFDGAELLQRTLGAEVIQEIPHS